MNKLFNSFIEQQILSFNGKKFKLNDIKNKYKNHLKLFFIEIKDQKVLHSKIVNDFLIKKL